MSGFFPQNFDRSKTFVLLAGRGDYPRLVWQRMQAAGFRCYIFAFEEADWLNDIPKSLCFKQSIGQVGVWLKALKKLDARYVTLIGQIKPKKLFHGLIPDLKAITLLTKLKQKNATTIFGTLIREMEALGIQVLDARYFVEDQLATMGDITPTFGVKIEDYELKHGIHVCQQLAELNVGQSVVVRKGTTIIAEGFDGTDAMIERAGGICSKPMGIIKLAKKTQDFRYDVPVFGLTTLQKMHAAGIAWAALESQRTLILDKKNVLAEAKKLGIRLVGF